MNRVNLLLVAMICAIAGFQGEHLLYLSESEAATGELSSMAAVCPCERPFAAAAERNQLCATCRPHEHRRETGAEGNTDLSEFAVFTLGIMALRLLRRRGRQAPRPVDMGRMATHLDALPGMPSATACESR